MNEKAPVSHSLEELIAQRRAKLQKFRDAGTNPFPARFEGAPVPHEKILGENAALSAEEMSAGEYLVAGRLITRRDMGKAAFAHLQDRSGALQIYLRKDEIGDGPYGVFKDQVDLGDHLWAAGPAFKTKTGETTLRVKRWGFLGKALRPPPEKFHGMTDVEVRYRRREVDLFSNKESRKKFIQRQNIVRALRKTLDDREFIEVETPIMQPVPGGAAAKPFITHHETLDMDLYMRVAPELYLKRLLVGGLERVYEIGRAFRNEGIDTRHNPEFTILEVYQAFSDIGGMRTLAEDLVRAAGKSIRETGEDPGGPFQYRGISFSLAEPFAWLSLEELFRERLGLDYGKICRENSWREAARGVGVGVDDALPGHKCFERIFDQKIMPHLPPAAFVYGFPAAFSPLAKARPDAPEIAERFELFLAGEEVANAYSEQNDPDVQRAHFLEQARQRKAGDPEAMPADEEFLTALEHGMPPAGGLGIGVDRLTMILTGTESIREVILFPLLRPE